MKSSTAKLLFISAIFINSFIDLGHKILIQNTIFKIYDGQTQLVLTALINGLILLPYVLLLSPSGYLSDRFAKNTVLRGSAWVVLFGTVGVTVCYYLGLFWPAFLMTVVLATQSAIFGPAKYGYLKHLFGNEDLARGNGFAQAATIGAILCGTLVYALFFEQMYNQEAATTGELIRSIAPLGWLLIANAIMELICIYSLPKVDQEDSALKFDWYNYRRGKLLAQNLTAFWQNDIIRLSILGLASFWALAQLMLATFPTYVETRFAISNTAVIQAVMACSGIGIAIGSAMAGFISRKHIETGLVPLGAVGMSIGLISLPMMSNPTTQALCFLGIGVAGGLFIVPLNALIQFHASDTKLGRVLAANFWVQNVAMVTVLSITISAAMNQLPSLRLLQGAGIAAAFVAFYSFIRLPFSLTRLFLSVFFGQRYRINVQGMKNLPNEGGVLLLGNHVSWLDWAIVQIASPRRIRFVMTRDIYSLWYLNWFLRLNRVIPIGGSGSSKSLQYVSEALNNGQVVCLFPEGTFSRTGQIGTFKRGYERACEDANNDVKIVPFFIRGLWGSQFSLGASTARQQRNTKLKRNIIFAFGEPLDKNTKVDTLKRRVFDLSISSWNNYIEDLPTLSMAFIGTAKQRRNNIRVLDGERDLNASKLFVVSSLLADDIKQHKRQQNIGVLLPTGAGSMITSLACFMAGKTIVPLNYTASAQHFSSALEQADIDVIYTSSLFLERLQQRGIHLDALINDKTVILLEDALTAHSNAQRLRRLITFYALPAFALKTIYGSHCDPLSNAAILFSSGSEGIPKGIQLSHQNFMANIEQVCDVLNPRPDDVMMASLPAFHAFGLTVSQLLPLIEGVPVTCQPDPTDGLAVAKACAKDKATMMFGTSTFYRLYTRNKRIHPLMFQSLRLVIAGAEKLQPEVAEAFSARFNKSILEGYGTTECTPVASVNLPDMLAENLKIHQNNKPGSVGIPLPGSSFKIVDPDTFEELPSGEAGMILIGGAQVMRGYLNHSEITDKVIKTIDDQRWYVTGDKGKLDKDGFLFIVDRYSRFAKVGGEMVGLADVENRLRKLITEEDINLCAINLPDANKGEQIYVLLEGEMAGHELLRKARESGIPSLMLPKAIFNVEQVPALGSGKTDFGGVRRLAISLVG